MQLWRKGRKGKGNKYALLPQCVWDYGAYVRLANAICIDETGLCAG
jgi:hypothetical protein